MDRPVAASSRPSADASRPAAAPPAAPSAAPSAVGRDRPPRRGADARVAGVLGIVLAVSAPLVAPVAPAAAAPAGTPEDPGGSGGPEGQESPVQPDASAFIYQGELTQGGAPASGTFAMSFALWDDPAAGTQLGGTRSEPAVSVENGRFTVELDFGVDAMRAGPSWLEITVEGFTLTPRQAISAAPFAVRTRGIDVTAAGRVGIGGPARDEVGLQVEGGPGIATALAASSEDGIALTADSGFGDRAAALATQGAAVVGLAPNAEDWAGYFFGRTYLGTRSFVGRESPITPFEYFGVRAPVGGTSYGGMYVSTSGANALPFYGYAPGGVARAWTTFNEATDTWQVFVNGVSVFQAGPEGFAGANDVGAPAAAVNVGADGGILGSSLGVEILRGGVGADVHYDVLVDGMVLTPESAAVSVTPLDGGATRPALEFTGDGAVRVRLRHDRTGETVIAPFSLVIWRI